MKNKGILALTVVAIAVITLVVFFLLFKLQAGITTKIKAKTADTCRISVERAALLQPPLEAATTAFECVTDEKKIEEIAVAPQTIAEAFHKCSIDFLKGNSRLFKGEGRLCFLCSTIHFTGTAAQQQTVTNFYPYVFSQKPALSQQTYAEHWLGRDVKQPDAPLARQDYAILFLQDQHQTLPLPTSTFTNQLVIERPLINGRSSFILLPLTEVQTLGCTHTIRQKPL